ncbi:hypothetical protein [Microvirga sp. BSC39]|uniref:hypothetical protein n=1 Tax=Microvirga sp. BSC39 TaxID=1549810 RepID=UPI0004E90E1F|nr:hypothetical protein [Microvirga sp. BSC39]KFG66738.1 hypothetical protein JH26_25660 [Microvirga sp. BSC39]
MCTQELSGVPRRGRGRLSGKFVAYRDAANNPAAIQRAQEVKDELRGVLYRGSVWYVGTDACRVLGLVDANSMSLNPYQRHFAVLNPEDCTMLDDRLGGRRLNRVLINETGLRKLAFRALLLKANRDQYPTVQTQPQIPQPWLSKKGAIQ